MKNQTSLRRNLLQCVSLGSAAMVVLLAIGQGQQAGAKPADDGQRPNILFIMSDDHTYQAIGAYGDPRFQGLDITPTLDQLAEEGMLFDTVFCTNSG